jgi:carboxylesterase type B
MKQWVQDNIEAFGGDPGNVTLAGRSAGAYAVHAHALYAFQNPSLRPLFHRIVMISNAIPAQPKTPEEAQPQFDELCQFFSISLSLSGAEKLTLLRKISTENLVSSIMKLKHHTFRPVTDGLFILPGMVEYHSNGSIAKAFKDRRFKLFIGEMLNEETLYAATNSPEANYDSLYLQVLNYYAPSVTTRVLKHYELPKTEERRQWVDLYGVIISDGQVRAPSRFLAKSLFEHGVGLEDIWRYRISYRLSFIDEKVAPRSFGVAHAMDKPFWK